MQEDQIIFHFEDVSFDLKNTNRLSKWVASTIEQEQKDIGAINIIFCSDNYLLKLNRDYLDHDTFTDVITFNYVTENLISGDIFISSERVNENAQSLGVTFKKELFRVVIHGVLHLIGYNDKSTEEALEIRAKEDFYLTLLS